MRLDSHKSAAHRNNYSGPFKDHAESDGSSQTDDEDDRKPGNDSAEKRSMLSGLRMPPDQFLPNDKYSKSLLGSRETQQPLPRQVKQKLTPG